MDRDLHVSIAIRSQPGWTSTQVADHYRSEDALDLLREKIEHEVLAARSEAVPEGYFMLTPNELNQINGRLAEADLPADPVRVYLDNIEREAENLIEQEVIASLDDHPGFEHIHNRSIMAMPFSGLQLSSVDEIAPLMQRATAMGRFMQAVGLKRKPQMNSRPPFAQLEVSMNLRGDREVVEAMALRLRDTLAVLGKVQSFETELRPELLPHRSPPRLAEAMADRVPLPPIGAEAKGLLDAVGWSLKQGDGAAAFDAAETFVDLLRRSPELAAVVAGTEHARVMPGRINPCDPIDASLGAMVAMLRRTDDTDDLTRLFFQRRTVEQGILHQLWRATGEQPAAGASTPLAEAYQAVFGDPANMHLHLLSFVTEEKDAPTPEDRIREEMFAGKRPAPRPDDEDAWHPGSLGR